MRVAVVRYERATAVLKISILDTPNQRRLKPEGQLIALWAEKLRRTAASGGPLWSRTRDRLNQPIQLSWRMNMHDEPIGPMSAENVEEFDVWIFESRDLVVSVIPLHAPWSVTAENHEISPQ